MLLTPRIDPKAEPEPALDSRALFELGLEHVRRLSRKTWTDHNAHDPGITMLELLCYALTELGYRARFSVADLLATSSGNDENMAAQFFTPRQILTTRPLTERDYRKLLIDLPLVRNAWIFAAERTIYADVRHALLSGANSGAPGIEAVSLRGLYRVGVEYADSVSTEEERQGVKASIRARLEANRNLCEDFLDIDPIALSYFSFCAQIELEPDADGVEVEAAIRFGIANYLAPPVRSRSLEQMLAPRSEGGLGRSVAEVFEGPVLEHGFIDDEELDAADLRSVVQLSDIIRLCMGVPGVLAVRDARVNRLAPDANEQLRAVEADSPWAIPVPDGCLAKLHDESVAISLFKQKLPLPVKSEAVKARCAQLVGLQQAEIEGQVSEEPAVPLGTARAAARYHSVQHDFPETYGISRVGLPPSVGPLRQTQALQLKGYLLHFDQLLANYCAQLGNLNRLFQRNFAQDFANDAASARTRFAQLVQDFPDAARVYVGGTGQPALEQLLEDRDSAVARRSAIMEHLLARFGEDAFVTHEVLRSVFDGTATETLLRKAEFLAALPALGAERALAFDKSQKDEAGIWNTSNVSGLERRVAKLLGIADASRRNLGASSYDLYAELDTTPGNEFRFRLKHPVTHNVLFSSTTNYPTPEAARAELHRAIERGKKPEGYLRKVAVDGTFYFDIVDPAGEILAQRKQYFATAELRDAAIDALIAHLSQFYSGEGMYVLENLLLLPEAGDAPAVPYLPICRDPNCHDCAELDPYSYRLHVVLPAYAGRFADLDFRTFAEATIRREVPAHILPKVCWLGEADMAEFEQAYREWLSVRMGATSVDRAPKYQRLIESLFKIKNVFPTRSLHACSDDPAQAPFVIGRTALGTQPPKT